MPPKGSKGKRKAASPPTTSASTKQSKQSGQDTVSKKPEVNVPLDEGFAAAAGSKVFVDEDGTIYDASMNQSQVAKNNNKFYRLQLLEGDKAHHVHTRWGRVGEFGQVKTMVFHDFEDALNEFNKKFKDKSGLAWDDRAGQPKKGKYTFLEKNYDDDDEDAPDDVRKEEDDEDSKDLVESELPKQTQRLMELIFNESHFNSVLENIGYNNEKLPLGKLGKSTIQKGFEHLQELSSLIRHPSLAQSKHHISQREALEDFTNQYYSAIPHVFGRNRPPIIDNNDILTREVAMLDTLTDMEVANAIMKTSSERHKDADSVAQIDKRFEQLKLSECEPLDSKSAEYQALKNYLINTAGHTHNIRYRLQDIFRIQREGEDDRFEKSKYSGLKDKNRRLLWHGSRTTNFGGILSQGLRIAPPEAPVNGYAFGKGVYLADISTKSANYCVSSSSGNTGLLLLCEAELGNPMYELLSGDSGAKEAAEKAGALATYGIGRTTPQAWVDAGDVITKELKGIMIPDPGQEPGDQTNHPNAYLQYNEYICYDVAQIRLRYLVRFQL
ncbi:hypothetical protein LTR35_008746 [Friedmanniomyces endolithicus]|uniref:Poly [ADP-ribose] polymerase n=1 Tax=Friedmanniomyces endolithicus TaxID=329885 RepID=A0AAN6J6X0_9PEZI|nr:hypothetical protein LTR35_008746 [Friedmanniomyces endolithicus]KAK0295070.1 hypothetical protein LTS00_006536 [Friedmanniomyces endolithicus]KAK0310117.1 hypothetical protein LTR82_014940 [Friedmanniomyces endolithicus]